MIFKTVYENEGKNLVKLSGLEDNDTKGTWANCTQAVYNYAKKTFKDGEEVEVEYSAKNGEYNVTKITKKGQGAESKNTSPTCKDCGKVLKDDKYEKCYPCNQKNPSKPSGARSGSPDYKAGAPYGSLLSVEATRRNKLATMSSACSAVQVMVGQLQDADAIADMIIVVYDKLYTKLFGGKK